jgi:hypothetical protein
LWSSSICFFCRRISVGVRFGRLGSLRADTFTSMTMPYVPLGTRSEVSFTSAAFSPKMARSNRSSGASSVSPFGVILPTRMSPGLTSAPTRITPSCPRIFQGFFANVRDIARDFLGTEFRIPGARFEFVDVDRRIHVLFDEAFVDQDRVLKVVTAPRHERHEHVAPERQFPVFTARPIGQYLALLDLLAA